jgi:citrate/tricarballylate utilization protein
MAGNVLGQGYTAGRGHDHRHVFGRIAGAGGRAVQQLEAAGAPGHRLGPGRFSGAEAEVARQLQICNACRYCEGFCAVFPAMTRRLDFTQADVHYLANLCHNCGACLHACQYAPAA